MRLAAEDITNPALGPLAEKSGIGFFQELIPALIGMVLLVGALFFLGIMLLGSIQWISSGGDKAALEGARGRLSSALVGIIILFSVFALLKVIEEFFGIDILTLDIGPLKIQ